MVSYYFIYILTFFITAIWDILLRVMSENYDTLPKFLKWFDFMKYLQPYFKNHTLLGAALIAGFIGASVQFIILNIHKLPTNFRSFVSFMIVTFVVSALYGVFMHWSKLYPHLNSGYYNKLPTVKTMMPDGISGLIFQSTVLIILYLIK